MWISAAYQNAVREQKLAAEISAAKRERDFYMGQVDKAKGIEAMKERKRKVCPNVDQSRASLDVHNRHHHAVVMFWSLLFSPPMLTRAAAAMGANDASD